MDLKEFISKTISDIVLGIEDSSIKLESKGKKVRLFSPGKTDIRHVEFDVAVIVLNNEIGSVDAGGEIKVWGIAQVGAKTNNKLEKSDSTVSRIKFGIRID